MSSDLENAIQAVSLGNPSQVADANAFLLSFVESDEAWQPALDLVQTSTDDFISSFASNFLYTKIRKHWSRLNSDQRQAVFNVLSAKLNALASHHGVVNKLVVNRVSLALLCVCSRIPNGISAFASQAFMFFRAPDFQNRGQGPQLVALEMLSVVPTEVSQLDVARDVRLELEDGLRALLPEVLDILQAVAMSTAPPSTSASSVNMYTSLTQGGALGVLYNWLPVGITVDSLYVNNRRFLQFVVSQITSPSEDNVRKASTILSKIMTVMEYPRPGVRNELILWVLGEILSGSTSFSKFFGDDGDDDVAFEIVGCVVSIVTAELPLLSTSDFFRYELFDLLLTFLSQKPRKLAAVTFDVWCNLEDISSCQRHPFLTGRGVGSTGTDGSIYTKVLEVLLSQCDCGLALTDESDDLEEFRDARQGIQDVFISCYTANAVSFLETLNLRLHASCLSAATDSCTHSAQAAAVEVVFYVLNLIMGCIQESVKSKVKVPDNYRPALSFIRIAIDRLFVFIARNEPNVQTRQLLSTSCNFLGSCTFLLTCIDTDTVKERQQDFASLFSPSLSFLFQALLFPDDGVSLAAAKSILKLTTQGKTLLLVPYVDEMSVLQGMIQVMCPLLIQDQSPVAVDGPPSVSTKSATTASDDALLIVLEAVVRLLVQLPPRLADSYVSSIGGIVVEELDKNIRHVVSCAHARTPGMEATIVRPLKHICKIIKFCDVLFMPPLPSPGKGTDSPKAVQVLLPFLSSVWSSLQRSESVCVEMCFFQAVDEIFSVYSGILFSCRDVVALSELPRLGGFIVNVFKQWRRASAAACAASALESLVVNGPEVWSTFFVPLVCSMAMTLPDANAPSDLWAVWSSGEEDTTGGVLEAYLTLLHRCVLLCPDVLLTPFCVGSISVQAFDIIAGQIFSILRFCPEMAPLRATFLLVQCLFSCPTTTDVVENVECVTAHTRTSRDEIISRSAQRIGEGLILHILQRVGQQNIPSMMWGLVVDTLSSVVNSCCGGSSSDFSRECRHWFQVILRDGKTLPRISPQYHVIVLEIFLRYPMSEKRRFKLFMQDLSKICAGEQDVESVIDYAVP